MISFFALSMEGNLRNAIAREAHAVIGLHPENKEDVRILLNHFAADVEK